MKAHLQRLLVCLLLCFVTSSLCIMSASANFQDVPDGHWAAESIQRCVAQGYFNGQSSTHFGLGQQMTRSAFTVVLSRFFGWDTPAPEQSAYRDVPADAWYAGAVAAAYTHGAITEQRDDFRPNDPITREELTVMLVRALGYNTIAGLVQDLPLPFTDVTTNRGYITAAYDLGLLSGTSDSSFSPKNTASREQVAVILIRLYDKLHNPSTETAGIVSGPADLTDLDVAAIPAASITSSGNTIRLDAQMPAESAAALRDSARQSGAAALLHVTGNFTVLFQSAADTAATLAQAVSDGDYDGLLLDIPSLSKSRIPSLVKLAAALDSALGDAPLYLTIDAPTCNATPYDISIYTSLASSAEQLVLRIPAQESTSAEFPVAPLIPLEDLYYAISTLKRTIEPGKLSLMLTLTPSVWIDGTQQNLSGEEINTLLSGSKTEHHYSERYACAYLTGTDADRNDLVIWYPDAAFMETRLQLLHLFGVGQCCFSERVPALPVNS